MAFENNRDVKENSPTPSPSPTTFGSPSQGLGHDSKCVRYEKSHAELEEIMRDDSPILLSQTSGIKRWLENVYTSSRGIELGTFDASPLPIIWKKQSANCEALALGYVDDIISLVHSFTVDLLTKICKDPRAREGLFSVLLDHLTDRYKKSIDHTKFLLDVEPSGTPMTMNHYFADDLEKRYANDTKLFYIFEYATFAMLDFAPTSTTTP